MIRSVELGAVLSVTTGRVLSRHGMAGIYAILNFMTGDTLFSHQLSRARAECRPSLIAQYPVLEPVRAPFFDGYPSYLRWLRCQENLLGTELEVQALPHGFHRFVHPIDEAAELMGGAGGVVVADADAPGSAAGVIHRVRSPTR